MCCCPFFLHRNQLNRLNIVLQLQENSLNVVPIEAETHSAIIFFLKYIVLL